MRAILNPTFITKSWLALFYLFDFNPTIREEIGATIQSRRTKYSMAVAVVGFMICGIFFSGIFAPGFIPVVCVITLLIGILYGVVAGCVHGLPVRPWIYLTTLREGTWLRVKRKQRCPCIYWGNLCTDIHDSEEMLVIYPEEYVRFFQALKNGTRAAGG